MLRIKSMIPQMNKIVSGRFWEQEEWDLGSWGGPGSLEPEASEALGSWQIRGQEASWEGGRCQATGGRPDSKRREQVSGSERTLCAGRRKQGWGPTGNTQEQSRAHRDTCR